jgi:hypothetical protein
MLQLTSAVESGMIADTLALITERIRGEFREMPGLALTAVQACRLWSLDMPTCTAVLAQLIGAGFLRRKEDGSYGRATDLTVHPRMAKAGIQFIEIESPRRAGTGG